MSNILPIWSERPVVIANLLNPAFCAEVLRVVFKYYEQESKKHTPYALSFIVLGILLHKATRDCFPKSKSRHFFSWLELNPQVRVNIDDRIKSLVPFTKEALMFLMHRKLIFINSKGLIEFQKFREVPYQGENEKVEIMKKAKVLGKILAKSGTVQAIYSSLGIKP